MTKNWLIIFISLFKKLQLQSIICSKGRSAVIISHGTGRPGQNIISSPSCQENILMLKRRQISSLKTIKRYSTGCRRYWDSVLQAFISGFKPIHYQMEFGDYAELG